MAEKAKGGVERGANFLKKFHYALGGIALVGAEFVPPVAVALTTFAVWEGAHGAFWQWAENRVAKRKK
jgi:hypothetical protein